MIRSAAITLSAGFLWGATSAWALTGTVEDLTAKAIEGARACYLLGGTESLCVLTDKRGFFELPTSNIDRVQISADGFIPRTVAAIQQSAPIALTRSGALWLRLVDPTGDPIAEGEIYLVLPNGARKGPFPVNANGVRIRTLPVESYRVVVRAPGYSQTKSISTLVEAGKEIKLDVPLVPDDSAPTIDG